jgi:hypothetical protein
MVVTTLTFFPSAREAPENANVNSMTRAAMPAIYFFMISSDYSIVIANYIRKMGIERQGPSHAKPACAFHVAQGRVNPCK